MTTNTITPAQRKRVFMLLGALQMTDNRDVIVSQFTSDRTGHVSNMTISEANELASFLESELSKNVCPAIDWAMGRIGLESPLNPPKSPKVGVTKPVYNNDEKGVKMRKKILHLLGLYGMTTPDGKFDYTRINEFITSIGSRNPDKKQLNFLTNGELQAIITQVEQMVYQP